MVVDIILPAVLGLICVREAGIEAGSDELERLGLAFFRHGDIVEERIGRMQLRPLVELEMSA